MTSIALNKSISNSVFYSVLARKEEGAALMSRGVFDLYRDAKEESDKYSEYEIWRHTDKDGKRVENKKVKCSINLLD